MTNSRGIALLPSLDLAGCLGIWDGRCVNLQRVVVTIAAAADTEPQAWDAVHQVMGELDSVALLICTRWRAGVSFASRAEALTGFGGASLSASARRDMEMRGLVWLSAGRAGEAAILYQTANPGNWFRSGRAAGRAALAIPQLFRVVEEEVAALPTLAPLRRAVQRATQAWGDAPWASREAEEHRQEAAAAQARLAAAERRAAARVRRQAAVVIANQRLGLV
jgi:hypothetical protein